MTEEKMVVFGGAYGGVYRYIVAAKSVAAAIRAFRGAGLTNSEKMFRDYGSVTSNTEEVTLAKSQPGVVFRRRATAYTSEWERITK